MHLAGGALFHQRSAQLVCARAAARVQKIVFCKRVKGVLALLILRFAVLQLAAGAFQLRKTVLVFGKPVLVFLFAVLVFLRAVTQLLHAVGILLLAVLQLDIRVRDLDLGVGKLLCAVAILLPAVVQLFARIGKLALGLAQLLVGFGFGVIQLLLRVVQLLRRLVHKLVMAQCGTLVAQRLERVDHGVNGIVILLIKRGQLRRALYAQIDRRVVIERKRVLRQIQIRLHRAGAKRGGAALNAEIDRGADRTDDLEALVPERVLHLLGRRERDAVPELDVKLVEQHLLDHALVCPLRHAPLSQHHVVDVAVGEGIDLRHEVGIVRRRVGVDHVHRLAGLHLFAREERGKVAVRQSEVGQHLNVGKVQRIRVIVAGVLHVRRSRLESGEERDRKRHQDQNRQKAASCVADLAQEILVHGAAHRAFLLSSKFKPFFYHSMFSTGVGVLFVTISATVPFLMRITRSAIGVSALLCVMTTTVTPLCRQVSCRSFKICLPVI